jgi:hypothetical protein
LNKFQIINFEKKQISNWNKNQNQKTNLKFKLFRFRKKKKKMTEKKAENKRKKNKNNLTWAGPSGKATHAGQNPSRNERELGFPAVMPRVITICRSGQDKLPPARRDSLMDRAHYR